MWRGDSDRDWGRTSRQRPRETRNAYDAPQGAPARPESAGPSLASPPNDAIVEQLGRILASAAFQDSRRLMRFLAFVVQATLAGQSHAIKGYTVAVEALGRDASFDPQSDPIVRVEAGRLRQALSRYYAGAGRDDALVIALPRGSYVPTFHRRVAGSGAGFACQSNPETLVSDAACCKSGILLQRRALARSWTKWRRMLRIHRHEIEAVVTEIGHLRQMLSDAHAVMMQLAPACGVACRLAPPLLPTAAPSQPGAPRTVDGRRDQQDKTAPAARSKRPRSERDCGHAADDGDDPPSLRPLRV
jgi:hypothetical protein